jgi:ribosomal protein L32
MSRPCGSTRPAHRVCPYSNATRGNIDVELTVDGLDVAKTAT